MDKPRAKLGSWSNFIVKCTQAATKLWVEMSITDSNFFVHPEYVFQVILYLFH